jgi:hypothetical protein
MNEQTVDNGALIFNEGDTADAAYTIVSGKIELLEIRQGKESQIKVVGGGEAFGEMALFNAQSPRPYSARAMEQSVITAITAEEFKSLLSQTPKSLLPFVMLAFEKMRGTQIKTNSSSAIVLESDISKVTVSPASPMLEAQFKPITLPIVRLPFRIGGYPEGGEVNRRDHLHLNIACHVNPLRVSRQHCEITIEDKALVITDLGSRFGTRVNGEIIGRGHGFYIKPLRKGVNEIVLNASEENYKLTVTCE